MAKFALIFVTLLGGCSQSALLRGTPQGTSSNPDIRVSVRVPSPCPAPCAAFFDATATTESNVEFPFHELGYFWDFGDPTAGISTVTGKSRNADTGGVAAHVFETPGAYKIKLKVQDAAGRFSEKADWVVNVQDPDVVFSAGNTRCVSTKTDFDGCPAGAERVTSADLDGQLNWVGSASQRRLLFHRGDTWTAVSGGNIGVKGPGLIGAYGICANPDGYGHCANAPILLQGSDSRVVLVTFLNNNHATSGWDRSNWRIMDLYFEGAPCDSVNGEACGGAISSITNIDDTLIFRNVSEGFRTGFGVSYWAFGQDPIEMLCDGVTFSRNRVRNAKINQVYFGGTRLAFLENEIGPSRQSHVLRVWLGFLAVISGNILQDASAENQDGRHALKLHSPPHAEGPLETQFVQVADNRFRGSGPWPAAVGPEDAAADERVSDVVFTGNSFDSHSLSRIVQVSLNVWARNVTVSDNVFDATAASNDYQAIGAGYRGIEPRAKNLWITNNTVYRAENAPIEFVSTNYVDNFFLENNLIQSSSAQSTLSFTCGGCNWNRNLLTANAGFVSPGTGNFRLSAGSVAIGAALPSRHSFFDFLRNPMNGPPDLGAIQFAR